MHQTFTFNPRNDTPGVFLIRAGHRFAFRESLNKALLYTYEAARRGDAPFSIERVSQDERLDASAILQGWKQLGLEPLPIK